MATPKTMRAINITKIASWEYNEIASVSDLVFNPAQPFPQPTPEQLLIKVHAVNITPYELSWPAAPAADPRVVSHDVAGVVVSGPEDSEFQEGDKVFGLMDFYGQGGMAEYTVTTADVLAKIPEGLSFEEAASLPRASLTLWQGMKVQGGGMIKEGDNVLILGATGAVGRMAIQMIRYFVGKDAKIIAMGGAGGEDAKSLGADFLINYREVKDWTEEVKKLGVSINLIFDAVGKKTLEAAIPLVKEGGKIVTIGSPPPKYTGIQGWDEIEKKGNGLFFIVRPDGLNLKKIAKLVERGVVKPSVSTVVEGLDQEKVREGWMGAFKGGLSGKPGSTVVKIL
ncbi:putative quinone oxidoreductase [Amylocarpus encephaloides]|uniref:Quinone oxidoreductase n=1 Tax=Amylocarpus encephaloides TaxID=45428 RepID=A0A9P7Y7K7_9HELO|nr:putative quinone oxidoreductase [Amylocarpus encephaloides]